MVLSSIFFCFFKKKNRINLVCIWLHLFWPLRIWCGRAPRLPFHSFPVHVNPIQLQAFHVSKCDKAIRLIYLQTPPDGLWWVCGLALGWHDFVQEKNGCNLENCDSQWYCQVRQIHRRLGWVRLGLWRFCLNPKFKTQSVVINQVMFFFVAIQPCWRWNLDFRF